MELPISVKGVVFENGRVWLRQNPRKEWELPGGRLEANEQPEAAVVREIKEELGCDVEIKEVVHAGVLDVPGDKGAAKKVFVVTYLCNLKTHSGEFENVSEDGLAIFQTFDTGDLMKLNLPKLYVQAIQAAIIKL